jgi:dihydrofolate reductase
MIKAILCVDKQDAIGQNGDMPWGRSFPKDLEYFKRVTLGQMLTFGRKTSESLPFKGGVFPDRSNNVVTSKEDLWDLDYYSEALDLYNWFEDFETIKHHMNVCSDQGEDTWVVGGASIYEQFADIIDEWHITTIDNIYPEADTFFKVDLTNFEDTLQYTDVGNGDVDATVSVYRRKR